MYIYIYIGFPTIRESLLAALGPYNKDHSIRGSKKKGAYIGDNIGGTIGVTKGDTRSLDYSSYKIAPFTRTAVSGPIFGFFLSVWGGSQDAIDLCRFSKLWNEYSAGAEETSA